MEENTIDQVIAALSEIEDSAASIEKDIEAKKSEYAKEIENKIKAFDEELAREHSENMSKLAEQLDAKKEESMLAMRADMEASVRQLDEVYEKNHEMLAKEIFNKLVSE